LFPAISKIRAKNEFWREKRAADIEQLSSGWHSPESKIDDNRFIQLNLHLGVNAMV
jgi:hypothetical protein